EQAVDQAAEGMSVLLVTGEDWSFGLIGLVAGRLAEEFHRPAFALSHRAGEYRASGRGPDGVDLGQALAEKAALFRRFGGHARAAGFTVTDADFPELHAYLTGYIWTPDDLSDEIGEAAPTAAELSVVTPDCALPLGRAQSGVTTDNSAAVGAASPISSDRSSGVQM